MRFLQFVKSKGGETKKQLRERLIIMIRKGLDEKFLGDWSWKIEVNKKLIVTETFGEDFQIRINIWINKWLRNKRRKYYRIQITDTRDIYLYKTV